MPLRKPTHNQTATILLAAILVYAAVLRITGLGWGLPNSLHYFSYHPDESVVVMHATPYFGGMNVLAGDILPHFYNYGTLQLYLIGIVVGFAHAYGVIGSPIDVATGSIDPVQWAKVYYVARWITVVMGIGTVWATYALGRRLWGAAAGIVAALALTIMPLHAQHSHFVTVDVPATFWVTLSLLWAAKATPKKAIVETIGDAQDQTDTVPTSSTTAPSSSWFRQALPFILSGLFAGLATATKYNCALVIISLLVAGHFAAFTGDASDLTARRKRVAGYTFAGLVAAGIAFLVGCPGALMEHAQFIRDLRFESDHVYHHPEIYFQQTGPGWWYLIMHNLFAGLGVGMWILAAVGAMVTLWKREREETLIGAFALLYFCVVSLAASRYSRYELPLLPCFAVMIAGAIHRMPTEAKPAIGRRKAFVDEFAKRIMGNLWLGILVIFGLQIFWLPRQPHLVPMFPKVDYRDEAADWLKLHLTSNDSVGFASTPWFWTPPLNPFFSHPQPSKWLEFASSSESTHYIFNPSKPFDADQLESVRPEYVILSEYEYRDKIRLNDPDAAAYLAYLKANYHLELLNDEHVPPWKNRRMTLFFANNFTIPHDMLYTCPDTSVWVRNDIQEPATAK